MKNYKINMNRMPLNEKDISKGQNFNQVLKNYKAMKTPILKMPKFWFGASAALVATVAAVIMYNKVISTDGVTPPSAFLQPPVAKADIPATTYILNAGKDSVITHPSGSKIRVPANAFVNSKGEIVKGQVELSYREFHKVSEIFLAGIPMTYDSAGEQYHFETAGMMDIAASQNGEALYTNPNALIRVDMVSYNNEDKFNTYYLDTVEKKWKYLAQDNYNAADPAPSDSISNTWIEEADNTPTAQLEKELAQVKKEITRAQEAAKPPVKPQKQVEGKPRFSIKVDDKEFPEIAVYNNVKFQVEDKNYDPAKADILWENVEIKRVGSDKYLVVFTNGTDKYEVAAVPVLSDKDYAAAKKIYEAKFAEYEARRDERKANEAKLKTELEARAKEIQEQIKKEVAEMEKRRREYESRLQQSELVYRTFQVNNFGIWNCDRPNSLPQGANVLARLKDAKTGKDITIRQCYLVEKGRDAMFSYYTSASNITNFRFDPSKDNVVWVVTNELKVGILRTGDFKAAQKTSGDMDLELTIIGNDFKSSEEVKQYLEI